VVIVNHHLFFADLALRGGDFGAVLPDYSTVIFDEAHELEDVAASYFGCTVSTYRILDLMQDANMLSLSDPDASSEMHRALARLGQRADGFWLTFRGESAGEHWQTGTRGGRRTADPQDGRYALSKGYFVTFDESGGYEATAAGEAYIALSNALARFSTTLSSVNDPPPEVDNLVRRAESLKFDLEFIVAAEEKDFVYWYERRGRGIFLSATPIDVSGIL